VATSSARDERCMHGETRRAKLNQGGTKARRQSRFVFVASVFSSLTSRRIHREVREICGVDSELPPSLPPYLSLSLSLSLSPRVHVGLKIPRDRTAAFRDVTHIFLAASRSVELSHEPSSESCLRERRGRWSIKVPQGVACLPKREKSKKA